MIDARIILLGLVAACGTSNHRETPSSASATPAASVTWHEPPCSDMFVRYRAALAAGKGTCKSDQDCARYGGVDPEHVCGGVTDAETARKLTQLAEDPSASKCPKPGYSCPALVPKCTDGVCR
jgi:hypothetical protein